MLSKLISLNRWLGFQFIYHKMNKDCRHDYEKSYEGSKEMRRSRFPLSSNEDDTKMTTTNKVLIQESTYKCNTCGKTFSNEKTLGGHRRSHFLNMKPNHHQSQGKTYFNDDSYDDEEIPDKKK